MAKAESLAAARATRAERHPRASPSGGGGKSPDVTQTRSEGSPFLRPELNEPVAEPTKEVIVRDIPTAKPAPSRAHAEVTQRPDAPTREGSTLEALRENPGACPGGAQVSNTRAGDRASGMKPSEVAAPSKAKQESSPGSLYTNHGCAEASSTKNKSRIENNKEEKGAVEHRRLSAADDLVLSHLSRARVVVFPREPTSRPKRKDGQADDREGGSGPGAYELGGGIADGGCRGTPSLAVKR